MPEGPELNSSYVLQSSAAVAPTVLIQVSPVNGLNYRGCSEPFPESAAVSGR